MAEEGRATQITQLLNKLKEIVDRLHPLLSFERLDYNMILSQQTQLRMDNEKLKAENEKVKEAIARSVDTANRSIKAGEDEMNRLKAEAAELYSRAWSKYQELQGIFNGGEQKAINKHLKELEEVSS